MKPEPTTSPTEAGCVFCERVDQPPPLFETDNFYAMPDMFPLLPGHVLIISKPHLRCLADATYTQLVELDQAAGRASKFLVHAYGGEPFIWENGITGQSVFHSHLHLVPCPRVELPQPLEAYDDVVPLQDWAALKAFFTQHGRYRYLELGDQNYLIGSTGAAIAALRLSLDGVGGLAWTGSGWIKPTSQSDVDAVVERWRTYPTSS